MAYAMGGRVAEEIVFHDPSTGASNDIEKATATARKMVTQYGMSERIGAVKLGSGGGEPFLGRDAGHDRDYSDQVAFVVDEEVRRLIDQAHDEAYAILNENREVLDRLALELLERETLNQAEIAQVFADIRKRDVRAVWLSKDSRPVSTVPPVITDKERRDARAANEPAPETVPPQDQLAHANLPGSPDAPSSPNGVNPGGSGEEPPHTHDG
jgi:cell division protease FtsH